MSNLFNIPKLSEEYNKYRHSVPSQIVDAIISYLSEKVNGPFQNALDVGCGTGQSTRILSPYFDSVIGTDVSETQLYEARRHPGTPSNVQYRPAAAESLPFEKGFFQLITAGSSFHWFDKEKFLGSARATLKDDGVLAIYIMDRPYIWGETQQQTDKIKNMMVKHQKEMFYKYWDLRVIDLYDTLWSDDRKYADLGYLGFKDERRMAISIETEGVSLDSIIGWETTMPEYYKLVESEGQNAGLNYKNKLKEAILEELGIDIEVSGETKFRVGFTCTLIVARK